jgi:hypothetical protein
MGPGFEAHLGKANSNYGLIAAGLGVFAQSANHVAVPDHGV